MSASNRGQALLIRRVPNRQRIFAKETSLKNVFGSGKKVPGILMCSNLDAQIGIKLKAELPVRLGRERGLQLDSRPGSGL